MSDTAYIGLGSNMGDKEGNIKKALEMLENTPGISVKAGSSLYRTAPVGYTGQDWFLNAAAELRTSLSPQELLFVLLDIERQLGRVRTTRWGPRVIDLDLLIFGTVEMDTPGLILPHPHLGKRAFVMVPLAEIAPGLDIPGQGKASELAAQLAKIQDVSKV